MSQPLQGFGVSAVVPAGWDARIYARPLATASALPALELSPFERRPRAGGGAATLQVSSSSLVQGDGEFGTQTTYALPRNGLFMTLIEYQVGAGIEPGVGLYAAQGAPRSLSGSEFAAETMLRPRPGQLGVQRFFTVAGRPFCLYAVLGSAAASRTALPDLNRLLASLRFDRLA